MALNNFYCTSERGSRVQSEVYTYTEYFAEVRARTTQQKVIVAYLLPSVPTPRGQVADRNSITPGDHCVLRTFYNCQASNEFFYDRR